MTLLAGRGGPEAETTRSPDVHTGNAFGYRADIQGLRMIAVVLVVLDHLFGWPHGGFIGVDVFFVISGFLITGLLLREGNRSGRVSISNFYRRRARRILPVSLLVLGTTVTASYVLLLTSRFEDVVGDAWWSLFFMVNWHFEAVGTDYFQSALPPSPLQHYWSLAVEEQFYLVWPLLIVALLMATKRIVPRLSLAVLTCAFAAAIVACSFALAYRQSISAPTVAYFSTFTRAWELGAGALVAAGASLLTRLPGIIRNAMGALGIVGIVASAFVIDPASTFPAPTGALPIVSTCLVLAAGIGVSSVRSNWILTLRPFVYVGAISYSLYLWHWPVIVLLESVLAPGLVYYVTAISLMTVLTVASYHLVEKPILGSSFLAPVRHGRGRRRSAGSRSNHDAHVVVVGALGVVLILLSIAVFNQPTRVVSSDAAPPVLAPVAASDARAEDPLQVAIKDALSATEFPSLSPPLDDIESGIPEEMNPDMKCIDSPDISLDLCNFGDPAAPQSAFVVGDSVSMSWMPAIRGALEPNGYRVHGFAMANCPFVAADILIEEDPEYSQKCNDSRDTVVEQINTARPTLLIISDMEYGIERLVDEPGSPQAWMKARTGLIDQVAESGARIVILAPDPFGKAVTECATRVSSPSDCVSPISPNWTTKRNADEAAAKATGATFVDTRPWFCFRSSCPIFVSGIVVRWDTGHITSNYGRYLIPRMTEVLLSS
ncbi:hypothetical protein CH263_24480 [Rhodococcus sp. 06-1059B-a]|nr:acyltransferase family protein [Rhodococcus sp. 06-1059B-a]OZD58419.1 hypothetical protein CH263_24480 [Rhodococcus sp. 06-1059B-a]